MVEEIVVTDSGVEELKHIYLKEPIQISLEKVAYICCPKLNITKKGYQPVFDSDDIGKLDDAIMSTSLTKQHDELL